MLYSRSFSLSLAVFSIFFLVLQSKLTQAAVFNVTNGAQLNVALEVAESNNETDFINLAPGTYDNGGEPFTYDAVFTENFGLNIVGSGRNITTIEGSDLSAVMVIDTTEVLSGFNVNINIQDVGIEDGSTGEFSNLAGGLTIVSDKGNIMIDDCLFAFNSGGSGGGLRIFTLDQVSISNSGFQNNTSITTDGGGALLEANFILLTDNEFTNNQTAIDAPLARGGGLRAEAVANDNDLPANGTMILNGNVFNSNDSEGHGGASLTADFGVALQGNGFENNTAGEAGAGGLFINVLNDDPGQDNQNTLLTQLFSNLFRFNMSQDGDAGGAEVIAGVDIIAVNNIFLQNNADSAGGALFDAPDIIATNNTLTLNNAVGDLFSGDGGGMMIFVRDDTTAEIYNNIAFDNTATGVGADIFVDDDTNLDNIGSTVDLVANDFSNFFSVCEIDPLCIPNINDMDNIDRDPRFVNAAGGDVSLMRNSPARRAGDPNAPELPSSDAMGNPVGNPPDMGALQFVGGGGGGGGNGGCSVASQDNINSSYLNLAILLILPILVLASRYRKTQQS